MALLTTLNVANQPKSKRWVYAGAGLGLFASVIGAVGVNINALQLTQSLPRHLVENVPNLPIIGFYSSWEGILAQLIYLSMIPIIAKLSKY